jgi:hypothetical protein
MVSPEVIETSVRFRSQPLTPTEPSKTFEVPSDLSGTGRSSAGGCRSAECGGTERERAQKGLSSEGGVGVGGLRSGVDLDDAAVALGRDSITACLGGFVGEERVKCHVVLTFSCAIRNPG